MSAIIISGGAADREFVKEQYEEAKLHAEKHGETCYVIAADKGVECCLDLGIVPDHIVGDFDSIEPAKKQEMENLDTQITYLNPEKDDTDSEAALNIAFEESSGNIYFVGSTGTRLDHVLGNMMILGKGPEHNRKIWMAVKLTNKRSVPQLKGFVNGVLRSIAREEKKVSFSISEKYSMPEWIVEDFTERFGEEKTEEILAAFLNAHDTTIRTNTAVVSPEELRAHLEAEGVTVKPVKELPYAFQISDYDHLSSLKAFQDGEFYIQDLSSMMVAERAGVEANQEVLDVCAAPGGKSLHVAELLKGTGSVRSRDLTEMKVDLIRENIERSNMKNMVAEVWDARELDEKLMEKEDIVIADLPCSGLGIIGKKPDIKYRITREDQESLQALQREILSTVHQYVKPGGTLVFSTCTICKLENEDNVEWFQEQFKDFTLESMEQILPGKDYMDGFFISVFKRK